jgi:hypothetical protein
MASLTNPSLTGAATPNQNQQIRGATPSGTLPEIRTSNNNRPHPRPWNPANSRSGSQPTNDTINHSSYGTDPQRKNPHHYRFLFNNINGVHFSSTSILELMSIARGLQLDWLGLAETHLDTHKQHVQSVVRRAMSAKHNGFKSTNCVFSQSDLAYEGNIKFGGVLQLATDNLASRTTSSHSDKYGRWTSQTHIGQKGAVLTTISAYRVATGCKGPTSAYAQQRSMLVTEKKTC